MPPSIAIQPTNQTVEVGASASLTVSATGSNLAYQWLIYGTNISGATSATLLITNAQLTDAGIYSVLVTNAFGAVSSSNATLQVLPPYAPSIQVNGQLAVGTMGALQPAIVTMSGGFPGGLIFYTLDGSTPGLDSAVYEGPITLNSSAVVSAMALSSDFSQTSFAPPVMVNVTPTYNLQTSVVGSGTVNVNPPNGPYVSNSVVMVTATPGANWNFDYWSGDATGSLNPLSLTVNGQMNVQAVFVQTAYPLTVSSPGGGNVMANGQVIPPNTYYSSGTVVPLTATASNGWSFLGWQGDASGTNNPLSVVVNQTNNIQAIFGTIVNTNAVGGGSIVLGQPNPIPYGMTLTVSAVPNPGNYFVIWTGAATGTNAPTTVTLTNANPTVNALFTTLPGGEFSLAIAVIGDGLVSANPQKRYYNPGDSVMLSATPNAGSTFYGWAQNASGTNNPLSVNITTNTIIQAYFIGPPAVSISPLSTAIPAGSNFVLTATASGFPPLSYQWQDSEGAIAGATNAIFSISNAQVTNNDDYFVVVTNTFGSATSAVATVTVILAPSVIAPPQSQEIVAGSVATLTVTATGTPPLNYQWVNSLGPIPGATNAGFTLNPALTNDWDNYYVVISNVYGVATSSVASLVVYVPVSISIQPASLIVPLRSTASFTVTASGYPAPFYQWTINGTNLDGATSSAITISNVSLADIGDYQLLIGNGYSTTNSYIATLNVPPTFTSLFQGAITTWGNSADLSVGAVGSGPLNYQWYFNGVAIPGATSSGLDFTSIQFTNAGQYSVVVSSPYGAITNAAYQVIVNPANVSLAFCPSLTIGGTVGYSYIIQSSTDLGNTNAWITLTNLTLTQPVQIWVDTSVDATSPFNSKVFYRILPGQ